MLLLFYLTPIYAMISCNKPVYGSPEEYMTDRTLIGFPNARRANRMDWTRPVQMITPSRSTGQTVNLSAIGMLVRLNQPVPLHIGDTVDLAMPRNDGRASLTTRGRVVRIERNEREMRFAIEIC
jgi:hypothetical protein